MPRCSACGTDNKAVAKFCRQCGAPMAQSVPAEDDDRTVIIPSTSTPPRTSPAASASGKAAPADAVPPAWDRAADASKTARLPQTEKSSKGAGPLIALAVAVLVVLAGGGYFLWNAISDKPVAAPLEQAPAPQPAPTAAAPTPQPTPAAAEAAPAVPPQAESAAPPATAEATPATPILESTPEPVAPPQAASADKKAKDKAAKAARAERRKREAAEKARRAASAPAPVAQETPAPAPPAPKPDPETARWARMKQELNECGGLNIFCREGVRWKFCNGYWGKVPACPGSGKN